MTPADRLRRSVDHAAPRLLALDAPGRRPGPQRWAPAETVGHLVDSAANNHGRFVRAGCGGGLSFDGYDQDGWVEAGRYRGADWPDLVTLWALYNRQLARVLDGVPAAVLDRPYREHSIARLHGLMALDNAEVLTLRAQADSYVDHLRRHLAIIDPALVAPLPAG